MFPESTKGPLSLNQKGGEDEEDKDRDAEIQKEKEIQRSKELEKQKLLRFKISYFFSSQCLVLKKSVNVRIWIVNERQQ